MTFSAGLHSPAFCVPLPLIMLWGSIAMCCVLSAREYTLCSSLGNCRLLSRTLGHPG